MLRSSALALCLLLAPMLADALPVHEAKGEQAAEWALAEFDWGDLRAVVIESLFVTPYLDCHRLVGSRVLTDANDCNAITIDIDDDRFLASFTYLENKLRQIRVLTPDLGPAEEEHLPRAWQLLIDYVTRFQGGAHTDEEFPGVDSIRRFRFHTTHTWKLPGQLIELGIGRRRNGKLYVEAIFSDPAWEDPDRARRSRHTSPEKPRQNTAIPSAKAPSNPPSTSPP